MLKQIFRPKMLGPRRPVALPSRTPSTVRNLPANPLLVKCSEAAHVGRHGVRAVIVSLLIPSRRF